MVKLEKLEKEVQRLPPGELALFRRWFRKFDSAAWDQQIVKDARSGKLDKIARKSLSAHRKGGSTELETVEKVRKRESSLPTRRGD